MNPSRQASGCADLGLGESERRRPAVAVRAFLAESAAWWRRWQGRRELSGLDARLLRDIGLTDAQVAEEVRKPFWRP